jgi:hypothetical protein
MVVWLSGKPQIFSRKAVLTCSVDLKQRVRYDRHRL